MRHKVVHTLLKVKINHFALVWKANKPYPKHLAASQTVTRSSAWFRNSLRIVPAAFTPYLPPEWWVAMFPLNCQGALEHLIPKCFLCYVNDGFFSLGFTYTKQKQKYLHSSGTWNASHIQKVKKEPTCFVCCHSAWWSQLQSTIRAQRRLACFGSLCIYVHVFSMTYLAV